jgi:hypothetical protein
MRGAEFPYVRERGCCDICGALVGEENLVCVQVRRGRRGRKRGSWLALPRAIYVCGRHELTPADGDGGGPGREER